MGRYLDKIRALGCDKSDVSDKSPHPVPFCRLHRFSRTSGARFQPAFEELERRLPDHIDVADWRQTVEDARAFLAKWALQAETLGWTPRDLFGLQPVPSNPSPSFRRLARYDMTGLLWLLKGRPVVALTAKAAFIGNHSGSTLAYYRSEGATR